MGTQYGSYNELASDRTVGGDISLSSDQSLIAILLGVNEERNPRKIAFGEWRMVGRDRTNGIIVSSDGVTGMLVDQWGNPFRIAADGDDAV